MKKVEILSAIIHRNVCGCFSDRVDPDQSWVVCNAAATEIIKVLAVKPTQMIQANSFSEPTVETMPMVISVVDRVARMQLCESDYNRFSGLLDTLQQAIE